jgi:hypothetical protein
MKWLRWFKRKPEPPAIPHWNIRAREADDDPTIKVDYTDEKWGENTMATRIRAYWDRHS